jgi:hypothetical protein
MKNLNKKTYNGWANYNQWNVSLWLNNDYYIARHINEELENGRTKKEILKDLCTDLLGQKTGDGVRYTKTNIKAYLATF